jgi:hypothetical protein
MSIDRVLFYIAIGTIAMAAFSALFLIGWLEKSSNRAYPLKAILMASTGTIGVIGLITGVVTGFLSGYLETVIGMLGLSIITITLVSVLSIMVVHKRQPW